MGCDDLPAQVREFHPGLGLPAHFILITHLEFQIHRGEVIAQGQNFQAPADFLNAGARCPRRPVLVNFAKAIAVLMHGIADRPRVVPECVVQNIYILVDQGLFVFFKQGGDFRHHGGIVLNQSIHAAVSIAFAKATNWVSVPQRPIIDIPMGSPFRVAPGIETCGTPVRPPWLHRQAICMRSGSV